MSEYIQAIEKYLQMKPSIGTVALQASELAVKLSAKNEGQQSKD